MSLGAVLNEEATLVELNHESRLQSEDHQSIRLWLRLLTCTNMLEKRLRARLREEFATTLPRFDFMAQLDRTPNGLTMGELSQRMMVSGVTFQVSRISLRERVLSIEVLFPIIVERCA